MVLPIELKEVMEKFESGRAAVAIEDVSAAKP